MKSIAQILALVLIPIAALSACSKGTGDVDGGNAAADQAFQIQTNLWNLHAVDVDNPSISYGPIARMPEGDLLAVKDQLREFHRLMLVFLASAGTGTSFVGDSQAKANAEIQNSTQMINWIDGRLDTIRGSGQQIPPGDKKPRNHDSPRDGRNNFKTNRDQDR